MFIDVTNEVSARRLIELMHDARTLAQRFRAVVCVIVMPTEFTLNVLPPFAEGSDVLLLPPNAAFVRAAMSDTDLGVCAVQVIAALLPMAKAESTLRIAS